MKIPPLPPTDLARIAMLPVHMQRPALQQVKGGAQGPNYNPTRKQLPDIVNRQPGPFVAERAPWNIVRENLGRACRSDAEEKMNLPVAKSTYDYCVEHDVRAVELNGYPITFSVGVRLVCWAPALFIYQDRLSVPFFDMRRGRSLTSEGIRFIFSAMDIALRINNPDFAEVEFEVLKFDLGDVRGLRAIREQGQQLLSYDELETRVAVTQAIWIEVLSERVVEERRAQSRSGGGFFG